MTALLRSLAPILVAIAAQLGIEMQEAQVDVWVNLAMWVVALASILSPSFRAWWNHREDAE